MSEPLDLLPCPFCGGKAEYDNDTGPNDEGFASWIACNDCGAKTYDREDWNRRTPSPVGTAPIEAARPEVETLQSKALEMFRMTGTVFKGDGGRWESIALNLYNMMVEALLPSPALDWTDPGHRLTESELDAAVKLYHDTRRGRNGFATTDRAALEAVIRGFLASNRAPSPASTTTNGDK